MKNYEQRLKVLEAGREEFMQKTNILNQEIQSLKKQHTDDVRIVGKKANKLRE